MSIMLWMKANQIESYGKWIGMGNFLLRMSWNSYYNLKWKYVWEKWFGQLVMPQGMPLFYS